MNGAAVEYGYRDWQELVLRDKLTGAYLGAPWALVSLGLPLCDG